MANSILSNNPTQLLTKAKVNVKSWTSYTPTLTNFNNLSDVKFSYRVVGDTLEISGSFSSSANGASVGEVSLPSGYTINFTALIGDPTGVLGINVGTYGSSVTTNTNGGFVLADSNFTGLTFGHPIFGSDNTANTLTPQGANNLPISGGICTVVASIPINESSSEAEFLAPLVQPKTAFIKELTTSAVASVADSVVTRALNSISGDTEIVTLLSNQFTLNPGKYQLEYFGSAYQCGYSATFIYDVTNSQYISTDKEHVYLGPSSDVQIPVQGKDTVELTEQTTFELRQFTDVTNASGLGNAGAYSSAGNPATQNKVSEVKITKLL